VSPEFRKAVEKAWQELPNSDKNTLRANGVKINIVHELEDEASSAGLYDPVSNQISVGQIGSAHRDSISLSYENKDPNGTLKHEVGHGLYCFLSLGDRNDFQTLYKWDASTIPSESLRSLAHFLGQNGPNEAFAEVYAAAQGRISDRVTAIKEAFADLDKIVESRFSRNR